MIGEPLSVQSSLYTFADFGALNGTIIQLTKNFLSLRKEKDSF